LRIGHLEIGQGHPCLVVAEIGMAHDGSLGMAHAYVDAAAKAGAGAVKFQYHRPEDGGEWRQRPFWCQDETRADYWRRTAFTSREWLTLREHAEEEELLFLCSAFSVEAAVALERLVPAWKIPSGQVTNGPLLDYLAAHQRPTIISAGMSLDAELNSAAARFDEVALLHTTSLYPTPLDCVDLFRLGALGWCEEAGLSDHSGTIWPALAAATMGAAMVEVHVTFSREAWGPDTASSITIDELRLLCEGIRAIRLAQQPVDREALLRGPLAEMRRVYMGVWSPPEARRSDDTDDTVAKINERRSREGLQLVDIVPSYDEPEPAN
jgi:N,N'-diacetyllegionaminate synthase